MCAMSGELIVNLNAIAENYRIVDSLSAQNCITAAVVKADAYGLGAAALAPALYSAGARWFFVATLAEGISLRDVLGADVRICVLNGFSPHDAKAYSAYDLIPVLNSIEEIEACRSYARAACVIMPVILHFDTGMNRLGLRAREDESILNNHSDYDELKILFVMSHFSSSDDVDCSVSEIQYAEFLQISKSFPNALKSLCNSGGVFQDKKYHFDLVRSGIALYGGNPIPEKKNVMKQTFSLNVPILQVKKVFANETCGYNKTYCFENDSHVAIVSLGYADGFFRSLSNRGNLYWKNYPLPVRGRVSMDLVICDLCHVPESEYPNLYDKIEVIGVHQSIDDLARAAGTISYEILTSLGGRYKRSTNK